MPDEPVVDATVVTAPKRRPGRPKKRHDPAEAPIDGDYSNDAIVNKQPGWDYGLVSDRERGPRQSKGWQVERWGPGCAKPTWDYGEHKAGDDVRVNNQLTLMKIPSERRAAIRKRERQWHEDAKAQLKKVAENTGGKWTQLPGVQF